MTSFISRNKRKGVILMTFRAYIQSLIQHFQVHHKEPFKSEKNKPSPSFFDPWFGLFPFSIKLWLKK